MSFCQKKLSPFIYTLHNRSKDKPSLRRAIRHAPLSRHLGKACAASKAAPSKQPFVPWYGYRQACRLHPVRPHSRCRCCIGYILYLYLNILLLILVYLHLISK